ncbi:MAG: hypothetical protein WD491_02090 [Balneolales bacterium]
MPDFPFTIPPSLSSFVEQFDSDPQKSTDRLETHLKKRGLDAGGYFILACLYHKRGMKTLAIENAMKAKSFAPGSPLFENLHFYLLHPQKFDAAVPTKEHKTEEPPPSANSDYDLNLDSLISKLSSADSLKVELKSGNSKDNTDLSIPAQMVSDLASETLAKINEKQEKYKQAIETLKTMQQVKPQQSDKYQKDIERINMIIENDGKE